MEIFKKYIVLKMRERFLKIKDMPYLMKYVDFENSFDRGIEFKNMALAHNKKTENKIVALDYILTTLKRDLQTDLLSNIIYRDVGMQDTFNHFPDTYYDKKGIAHKIQAKEDTFKDIDFEKDIVISFSWNKKKIFEAIKKIKYNGFIFKENNHHASYYTGVDICFATNGYHSISIGVHNKKGNIKAVVYDISPLFKHVYTDGSYWYDRHTKNKLIKVDDFRIALIFEITKEKLKLEECTDKEEVEVKEEVEIAEKMITLTEGQLSVLKRINKNFGLVEGVAEGRIKGKIELGIKFNISKDILFNEVAEETNIPKEKFDKLYSEIFDKINSNNKPQES